MDHPRSRRRTGLTLLAIPLSVASLVFAACGDSDQDASNSTPTSGQVIDVNTSPGTAKNYVPAPKDVTRVTCTKTGPSWVVAGKVTNRSTTNVDYRIYTSFVTKGNDAQGLLEVDVTGVMPRASKHWSGKLRLPDKWLHCILQVERTQVG